MKNYLKSALLFAGLAVLASPLVRADNPPAPPPPPADHPPGGSGGPGGRRGPGAMLERLGKQLNLTADQEAKWKEIGQQEQAAGKAIRDNTTLSQDDRRTKMRESRKPYMDQRRAVLTPDQQKIFDEEVAKMGERGPRPPRPE